MRWLACLVLLVGAGGCTPMQFSVPPPYPLRDRELNAEDLAQIAGSDCEKLRGSRNNLPGHAFTTDGCSAWPDADWRSCCIEHDIAYWCGGTPEQRKTADQQFQSCIAERSNAFNAWLMFWGVRIGGPRLGPWPWRWGYGHDWPFREQAEN